MDILLTALVMGLLGGGHCAAMCGTLTVAVGFSIPANRSFVLSAIAMSLGRIGGYAAIGFVANALSQTIVSATGGAILILSLLSGLMLLGVGLHIANVSNFVLKTEKLGNFIQPYLLPLKKKLTPIDTYPKCLAYGFLWGLLPCGLVYSALALALVAPNLLIGSLTMFCFGLGTLPVLIGLTTFSSQLNRVLQQNLVRLLLGIVVIFFAMYHLSLAGQKIAVFI